MKPRGLLHPKHPHVSFTQLGMFIRCPKLWHLCYGLGQRKPRTGPMVDGGATDRILKEITMTAKASPDGIDMANVENIIAKHAHRFARFDWFRRVVDGVKMYALNANETRHHIYASPWKWRLKIKVDGSCVAIWGELDRLDINKEKPEFWIREFKMVGAFMNQSDLEEDLQTSIYNMAVRYLRKELSLAVGWKGWYSVVRGFWTLAKADVDDAEATEYFIVGRIRKMLQAIRSNHFPATTARDCPECPGASTCDAWRNELRGNAGQIVASPTLGVFANLRERAAGLDAARDKFRELIKNRVDMNNGRLVEDGWLATLNSSPPKLDDKYQLMNREELLAELTTSGATRLTMKPAKGEA